MKQLFPLLLTPLLLNAQIEYSGSIHPSNLYRISDGSEISLPFRLVDMKLGYTWRDFDIKTHWAIETRWSDPQFTSNLREAYLVWYPAFGEVRLGKQIIVWGATDVNNPTDNLSAYNYYYLFWQGIDRKIGSLSAAILVYWKNWQIEMIVIPEHQANQLVFDEPDFPISQSTDYFDPRKFIIDISDPLELGIRTQMTIGRSDISLSYFRGHDRFFSVLGLDYKPPGRGITQLTWLGYRLTEIWGADVVSFWGDLTFRGETAYFKTINDYDESWSISFESKAEYIQYVLQAEYPGPLDISLMGQFIGNTILKANGETLDRTTEQIVSLDKDNFSPGIGTPFAMFADRSLLLTAGATFMDETLKMVASSFINLEEEGYMLGFTADYSPVDNWHVELGINKFVGDGDPDSDNVFNLLEDFSHVFIGLKYSF
ncbi:MAG: hypothetical protein IIA61_00710 [Candidatus Marinimicrobia bacterium]|nr:hypothetical protein [Candidatus Neomarinimicrobiota bacterium]